MATENRGVMVYLPPEVEEYITNFCTEYNITRKDREGNTLPSLGTGVVTYLKSKILGESPDEILTRPSRVPSNGLSKEEVLDLIREYSTSQLPSNGLLTDEVLTPLTQSIESLRETLNELESYTMGNFRELQAVIKKLEESRLEGVPAIPSGDISVSGVGTSNPVNSKVKKFLELPESDRAEVIRLLGDGIPAPERNDGMTAIFGWSADKSDKSKGEDCSRLKKHLKAEGLL
jgi:hypothetical protein